MYALNSDEPSFMSDMILLFNENCKGFGVIGDDFNCTLNPTLDRSNPTKRHNNKSSKVLQGLCVESGLIDVWRGLNQGDNWRQLTMARAKLNEAISNEIIHKMNHIRQKDYEYEYLIN